MTEMWLYYAFTSRGSTLPRWLWTERIPAGDQILAVNGQSLENVTHQEAVSTLKNAPAEVELLVAQNSQDAASFGECAVTGPSGDLWLYERCLVTVRDLLYWGITTTAAKDFWSFNSVRRPTLDDSQAKLNA